jgi:hypothetical protein
LNFLGKAADERLLLETTDPHVFVNLLTQNDEPDPLESIN